MRKLASFMGLMLLILTTSIFTSCKEPIPEPKVYTVTFDAVGGSEVAAIQVKSGEKAVQPEEPTKEGFVFDAWYNGDVEYDWETPVTANLTLTAKWTDKTYTVTFDVEGIEAQEVKHKDKVTKPEDPTKDGCTFAGWYNGEDKYDFESLVTSDLELKAEWDVAKYSITFDVEGVKEIEVEHGNVATKPETDPTKDGYTFKGWMNGDAAYDWTKPVTADVELKPSWEVIKYTITYELPDGVKTDNPATYTIEEEVALKDATVPEGKYFGGWFTDKDYKTPATSIVKGSTGDKTFYAKLNDNPTFTLTLKDGEKEFATIKAEKGKVAEKPTDPTKVGYTFKGWMNGETAYDWKSEVTADLTLTASWDINKYTVTIDGVAQTVEHGKVLTKPADPTKKGFVFAGWLNGETAYDFELPVTSDLVLTAKWDVAKYSITFDVEGVKAIEVEYGKTAEKPADPTKEGVVFDAWYKGDVEYDWKSPVKANLELTAKWIVATDKLWSPKDTAVTNAVTLPGWGYDCSYVDDDAFGKVLALNLQEGKTDADYCRFAVELPNAKDLSNKIIKVVFKADGDTAGNIKPIIYSSETSASEHNTTNVTTASTDWEYKYAAVNDMWKEWNATEKADITVINKIELAFQNCPANLQIAQLSICDDYKNTNEEIIWSANELSVANPYAANATVEYVDDSDYTKVYKVDAKGSYGITTVSLPAPAKDFSAYKYLQITLKADTETGTNVKLSVFSDDKHGSEHNGCTITADEIGKWKTISLKLSDFWTAWSSDNSIEKADLTKISSFKVEFGTFTGTIEIADISLVKVE